MAKALLKAGYNVALAGRRREQLEETAGGETAALVVPTDVDEVRLGRRALPAASEKFGRVDLLFNNAGTNARQSPSRSSPTSSGKAWSTST